MFTFLAFKYRGPQPAGWAGIITAIVLCVVFAMLLANIPASFWEFDKTGLLAMVGAILALFGWWVFFCGDPKKLCPPGLLGSIPIILSGVWSFMDPHPLTILVFWGLAATALSLFLLAGPGFLNPENSHHVRFGNGMAITLGIGYDLLLVIVILGPLLASGWDKLPPLSLF